MHFLLNAQNYKYIDLFRALISLILVLLILCSFARSSTSPGFRDADGRWKIREEWCESKYSTLRGKQAEQWRDYPQECVWAVAWEEGWAQFTEAVRGLEAQSSETRDFHNFAFGLSVWGWELQILRQLGKGCGSRVSSMPGRRRLWFAEERSTWSRLWVAALLSEYSLPPWWGRKETVS